MNDEKLEGWLASGRAWTASGDRPDQDGRKVAVSVGLRKLANGAFHVVLDTYFVEGLYGTDISRDVQDFATLAAALEFIEAQTGLSPESKRKARGPLRERRRFKSK